MDEFAIKVENVSKTFKLPHEKSTSIKSHFVNFWRRKKGYELQEALKDVSFEVKKGEFFGIVGRNGSGKSTLLKLLAGIYTPTAGQVHVRGKLTPFIELGVGFNPELTGRENVFLNGSLLGFSRKEMAAKYDDIVKFAELERFMDQRLKNYSSGMQVRLAFSIAIQADTEILVLDEVLAVGDEAFQKKCNDYFEIVRKGGKTVILVTHSMDAVRRFCTRAMLLESGHIKAEGSPEEIANQYLLDNLASSPAVAETTSKNLGKEIKRLDIKPLSKQSLTSDEDFEFEVTYELNEDLAVDLGISVTYEGRSVIEHNTKKLTLGSKKNVPYTLRYKLPLKVFNPKQLGVDVAIFEKKGFRLIGFNTNSCNFMVASTKGLKGGLLNTRGEWIQQ